MITALHHQLNPLHQARLEEVRRLRGSAPEGHHEAAGFTQRCPSCGALLTQTTCLACALRDGTAWEEPKPERRPARVVHSPRKRRPYVPAGVVYCYMRR